jgi:hypothetical protein
LVEPSMSDMSFDSILEVAVVLLRYETVSAEVVNHLTLVE